MSKKGPQIVKLLYSETLPKSNELVNNIMNDLTKLQTHDVELLHSENGILDLKKKLSEILLIQVSYPTPPR